MADFFKRFGRGAVAGAGGATAGSLQHLLMQREQEQLERERAEEQPMNRLKQLLMQAQIEEIGRGEPEKPPTETGEFGRLLREDPDEYIRIKRAISGKGETKPAKTGIGSLEDILTGRQKFHEGEREDFVKRAGGLAPDIDFRETTPEGVQRELLSFLPKKQVISGEEQRPESALSAGDIVGVLKMLGIPLEPYQIPRGGELSALADSVQQAQTDPAVAGALLDYQPGAGQQQPTGELNPAEEATVNYLNNNPGKVATYDWDALKAEHPDIDVEKIKRQLQ